MPRSSSTPSPRCAGRLPVVFALSLCLLTSAVPTLGGARRAAKPARAAALAESAHIRQLSLQSNDLVYNAQTQRLYASVPSSAGAGGNSITEIDPASGTLGQSTFVGSEPGQLALSDDGQVMYVALGGAAAIRRFDVATQTPGQQFSVGRDSFFGTYNVNDLAVAPGNPNLLAVARHHPGTSPPEAGVAVFDNGVQRPTTTPGHSVASSFLAFSDSPATLYGDGLNTMTIDAAGVTISSSTQFFVGDQIQFAGGRIYSSRGQVVDPATQTLLGTFATNSFSPAFFVDVAVGRAYYVSGDSFPGPNQTVTLKAFDINTFVPVGEIQIAGVSGGARNLVRWGANGLAFRTGNGQIFLVQTTLVPSGEPTPTPTPTPSPTPTPTPVTFATSVRQVPLVSNDLIYNPARQTFHASVPSSVGAGGNSVVELNPETGALSAPVFVGSEPNKLAVSDDGTALYVGLDGSNSVRRVDTQTQTPGLQFPVGDGPQETALKAGEMDVLPGSTSTVAVTRRASDFFSTGGVAVFDNGTRRPNVVNDLASDLEFAPNGTRLYSDTKKITVGPSGASLAGTITSTVAGGQIDFKNGLHYSSRGPVVDPEADVMVGTFTGLSSFGGFPFGSGMAIDVARNRAFFLVEESSRMIIKAYELSTFLPVGSVSLQGVTVAPTRLWRWGANGLAFRTANSIVLVQTSLVDPGPPVPAPTPTPSPTPTPAPTPPPATFVREVSLPVNDVLAHQPSQTLYMSVASTAGTRGNTITPVNPLTGALGQSVFIGSEPGRMAMSSDNQVIYTALGGAAAIRRFEVPLQLAGQQFSVGQDPFFGNYTVNDLAVAPGNSNLLAVARHHPGLSPPEAGVAVFDSGVQRPVTTPGHSAASSFLAFSDSPATLYGDGLNTMTIASDGVRITGTTHFSVGNAIEFKNGVVYSSAGQAVNPSNGTLVGTFGGLSFGAGALTVDTQLNRIFFASENSSNVIIRAFDLNSFLPLGSISVPTGGGFPTRLVRWGDNGLALRISNFGSPGRAFIIQSRLVSPTGPVPSGLRLNSANFTTSEGSGSVLITVTRTGDRSAASSVRYATSDGTANTRSHYTAASGTLHFAPGETSKTFPVLLTENAFVEGPKTVIITLSDAQGAELLTPQASTLTIHDDDFSGGSNPNPSDNPTDFVRQHYHDFLGRAPDNEGLFFWSNGIFSCGSNVQCVQVKRVDTSAAFFLSIEFQETGYLVYRTYKAAFGDINPPAVPVPVRREEFSTDSRLIGGNVQVGVGDWFNQLEANKNAFTSEFVARQRFLDAYPQTMTPAEFVDKLNQNAGGALSQAERDALVADLTSGAKTRAQVLRAVAEDQTLRDAEFRKAFVLMQYFGYLRRDPDAGQDAPFGFTGYNFWLGKLNEFDGDFRRAEMVRAFIESIEYRQRFGQ